MKKIVLIVSFILIAVLFSSCVTVLSSDTTVKLNNKENWEVSQEILFEGESFKEYGQTVVDGLNVLAEQYKSLGGSVEFKELATKQGNIPYQVVIKGEGLETLNNLLGVPGAFTKSEVNGKTVYEFSMDGMSMSTGGLSLGTSPDFSFTLEGMNIVETNGKKNSSTSVTWKNSSDVLTATLTPAGRTAGSFPWWIIPVVLGGLGVIAFVILILTGVIKFKKKPQPVYGYPAGYQPTYYQPPAPPQGYVPPVQPAQSMETVVSNRGPSEPGIPPTPPPSVTIPQVPPPPPAAGFNGGNVPPPVPSAFPPPPPPSK
jgi:hypothetical protein